MYVHADTGSIVLYSKFTATLRNVVLLCGSPTSVVTTTTPPPPPRKLLLQGRGTIIFKRIPNYRESYPFTNESFQLQKYTFKTKLSCANVQLSLFFALSLFLAIF